MSKIGSGYGSEFHLRSALSERNSRFHEAVVSVISGTSGQSRCEIEWHPNYLKRDGLELRGMDFLPDAGGMAWKSYWPDPIAGRDPRRSGIHNWDAVGRLVGEGHSEWLLVEAKSHVREFKDSPACGAGQESLQMIIEAFQKTRLEMGLAGSASAPVPWSWLRKGGYQIANRLASLNFLLNVAEPKMQARLLFVYYINDKFPGRHCPSSESEWQLLLKRKYAKMGMTEDHQFRSRVHHLFYDCTSASGA